MILKGLFASHSNFSLLTQSLDHWYRIHMEYGLYKKIPNSLKQYRKARGFSQKEVANILGLKDNTLLSRWESGNTFPSLLNAIKLSKLYQVSVNELFSGLVVIVLSK